MNRILDYVYNLYLDILNGFINLWTWRKVIWHDEQIDFTYILKILSKKLELIENHLKTYGHCVDAKKTAQEIKRVRLAIQRSGITSAELAERLTITRQEGEP